MTPLLWQIVNSRTYIWVQGYVIPKERKSTQYDFEILLVLLWNYYRFESVHRFVDSQRMLSARVSHDALNRNKQLKKKK